MFLEAALLAAPETSPLAAPVTAVLGQFLPTFQIDLDTRRKVLCSRARGVVADNGLDGGLRKVFSRTLSLVEQDRRRPELKTLFPEDIGHTVRYALKRQVAIAAELVAKLALKLYTDAFRTEQTGTLQPLIDQGITVLDEQRKAEHDRADGRLDITAWKTDVNGVRTSVYGALLEVAGKTGRKKAWADGFFLARAARGEEEEQTGETPIDAGDGGGAP